MSRQDRSRCCAGRTIAVGFGSTQPVSSSSVHSMPWSYTCLAQQSSPPGCDQQSTPPQRSHVSGQQTLASTALFEGSSAKCTCPIFPIEHSPATAVSASVRRVTMQDRAGIGLEGPAARGPNSSAAAHPLEPTFASLARGAQACQPLRARGGTPSGRRCMRRADTNAVTSSFLRLTALYTSLNASRISMRFTISCSFAKRMGCTQERRPS